MVFCHTKSSYKMLHRLTLILIPAILILIVSISNANAAKDEELFDSINDLRTYLSLPTANETPPLPSTPYDTARRVIIHVGPPKTATTTLQAAITRDAPSFHLDNYYTAAPFHDLATCHNKSQRDRQRCDPDMRRAVSSRLNEAERTNRHLFISSEKLGDEGVDLVGLERALGAWSQNVTIVMVYRRFFEWLPSKYNQYQRTLKQPAQRGGSPFPGISKWLTPERIRFYYSKRYVHNLVEFYSSKFDNVQVFNMHDTTDVVSDFVCRMIPHAEKACEKAHSRAFGSHAYIEENKSARDLLGYERLVRSARAVGVLDKSIPIKYATNATRYRQEQLLKKNADDFPKECMDRETLDLILELSMETERELFPEWFGCPLGESHLVARFDEASRGSLCNIDVIGVLMDDGWKEFFQSMELKRVSL